MRERPRRNRRTPALRAFLREGALTAERFVLPLFIHEGGRDVPPAAQSAAARSSSPA
jgi:porphobilinogen synthase